MIPKSIRVLFSVLLVITTLSCQNQDKGSIKNNEKEASDEPLNLPDSLSSRRITFALKLRKIVAEKYWPSFGEKKVEGPFIYFNEDKSEIFFPSSRILDRLEDYSVFSEDYILSPRTDTIPYHFELMISFDQADSSRFFFEHPVQQFLSVEETGIYIPSVKSTEMWSTMVMHEMFHHFQYNNPSFNEYAKLEIGNLPFDIRNLRRLCQEDEKFLDMIQSENDYLMEAIAEQDDSSRMSLIKGYLNTRTHRIEEYIKVYPHLEQVENYYVLQEGSARYIEYQSMQILSDFAKQSNAPEIEQDPNFKGFEEFSDFDLTGEVFNYLTYAGPSDYHYTIGFNIMRLLDALKVSYKNDVLNTPEKGLHQYLEEYVNSSPTR